MRNMTTAPFIHTPITTQYIYLCMSIALIPPIIYAVFFYGISALILIGFSAFFSLLVGGFVGSNRDYASLNDGIILALMLPPGTSIYTAAVGVIVAEFFVKRIFGSMGNYFVAPAAFGRIVIQLMMPSDLGGFSGTLGEDWFGVANLFSFGGKTASIPSVDSYSFSEIIVGRFSSYIGVGCTLLIILGAISLIRSHAIKLHASGIFLVFALVGKFITGIDEGIIPDLKSTCIYMFTSGVVFAAVYLMTDPVTTSMYGWAAVLEGIIAGVALPVVSTKCSGIIAVCVTVVIINLFDSSIRYFMDILRRCGRTGDA